jgi:hypothetical protein
MTELPVHLVVAGSNCGMMACKYEDGKAGAV